MIRCFFRSHRSVFVALALALAAGRAEAAERIVSAGAAVTEILWEIGAAEEVIGVDSTSRRPADALATRPDVGYYRRLAPEGLLALAPTLVITVDGAGPRDTLETLTAAGVRVERLPEAWSAEGVRAKIEAIGRLVGREAAARRLAEASDAAFARLATERSAAPERPKILVLMSLAGDRPLAAGRGTPADALIGLIGGINAASDFDGYRQMTDEAVIAAAPEIVAIMDIGRGTATPQRVFSLPAFAGSPAAAAKRLIHVDGVTHLGFGPHFAEEALELLRAVRNAPM